MSTKEWLGVIDQAKALQIVKCILSGGEPMLHPGFFEILKKLVDSDILAYVCTNGSFIDKRIAHKFADMLWEFGRVLIKRILKSCINF